MNPEVNYLRTTVEPIAYKYTVRLDRLLTEPSDFQEELYAIRSATENDVVHILINSVGGQDDTMKALLSAIQQSPAHIVTEIEGTCCSAATMVFLAGSEFIVSDDAEFMIHTSTFGTMGKENNVRQQVEFTAKSNARLMQKYYKDFLTDDEIQQCIDGKDFWMDADEIMQRLEVKISAMQQELEGGELVEVAVEAESELVEEISKKKKDFVFIVDGVVHEIATKCFYSGITNLWYESFMGYFDSVIKISEDQGKGYLKTTAEVLGVKFSHNIGVQKLAERIDEKVKEIQQSLIDNK